MKCNQCGFENNDDANFCANCGNDLRNTKETAEPAEQPEDEAVLAVSEDEPETEDTVILEDSDSDQQREPAEAEEAGEDNGFILVDEEGSEQKPWTLMDELAVQTNRLKEEDPGREAQEITEVTEEASEPAASEDYQWYYVDRGQSRGPFDQGLFEEMAANGTIGPRTYIWRPGMENWMRLEETDFGRRLMSRAAAAQVTDAAAAVTPEEPAEDPLSRLEARNEQDKAREENAAEEKRTAAGSEWFYVHNSRSSGPYADEVMGQFIRSGLLDANTYVWKEGMDDWQHLGNTTLARYLSEPGERPESIQAGSFTAQGNSQQSGSYYSVPGQGNGYAPYAVRDHSVIMYIVLYFVTCGLFSLFWLYQSARDVDALAAANNVPKGIDPVLALILDIVTCGLFKVYFFWKEAMVLGAITGTNNNDQAILLCILGLICPVAAFAILQDQINSVVRG